MVKKKGSRRGPKKTIWRRIHLITEYCLNRTSAELCDPFYIEHLV